MPATNDPKPRDGRFMGMPITNSVYPDGTWLEGEEFCYPEGGMTRFAWVNCADGKRRRVKCGIPDTMFSIPARIIGGKSGFVSADDNGLKFTETAN